MNWEDARRKMGEGGDDAGMIPGRGWLVGCGGD